MGSKIVKIVPYFGKLPKFWPTYLKSLEFNKEYLDLLFITDIDMPKDLPNNVRVIKSTQNEFFNLIQEKTGISIPNEARFPYKLCDFKPLFGHVLEEEIKDYAYWAYGDIDIIFGDLSRYLKPHIINNHDVITVMEWIVCASFTIFKNTAQTRELYRQSPDLHAIFAAKKYVHFDEAGQKATYLRAGDTIQEAITRKVPNDIVCFTSLVYLAEAAGKLKVYARPYLKESLPFNEIIEYKNGKIIIGGGVEMAAYHFVTEKKHPRNIVPYWRNVPDHYFISTTGTYKVEQMKYFTLLHTIRSIRGWFVLFKKRIKDSINYRLKGSK